MQLKRPTAKERIESRGKKGGKVCGSLAAGATKVSPRQVSYTAKTYTVVVIVVVAIHWASNHKNQFSACGLRKRETKLLYVSQERKEGRSRRATSRRFRGTAFRKCEGALDSLCSQLPVTTCNNRLFLQHFHVRIQDGLSCRPVV